MVPRCPNEKSPVFSGLKSSLHTYLQYLLNNLCQLVAGLNPRLNKTVLCVYEQQKYSSSMWKFYLCRNIGLERTHKTLNWVPCYDGQLCHIINQTNPIWNYEAFCFQCLFSKSCTFLTGFARFWRLEKIHCKAILQPWGTNRGPNTSPHILTLPLVFSYAENASEV